MLVFGHVGLTTAAVKGYEGLAWNKKSNNDKFIDYRVVMVGALLPDLIDKPYVELKYGLYDHSGHWFAHSFIFSGILIAIGIMLLLIGRRRNVFLLGVCSLIHQLFDKLMLLPNVFSIPQFASIIPMHLVLFHKVTNKVYSTVPYLEQVRVYFMKPYVYIPELIGFLIIVYFICKLIILRRVREFFRCGRL